MGMSACDYWYGDVWLVRGYREADKLRQQRANENAWLQGMYFYEAVAVALKNVLKKKHESAAKYPARPYELSSQDGPREEQEEKERLTAMLYMKSMVKAGKAWGKERSTHGNV